MSSQPNMLTLLAFSLAAVRVTARDITFPPISPLAQQLPLSNGDDEDHRVDRPIDISGMQYGGLMTYANLPYVHCLAAEGEEVEHYDIAVMGAPFDTVSGKREMLPMQPLP